MTTEEAEDYRYGYRHTGEVNGREVSIRKVSNCEGWIDLKTDEVYSNESVEEVKIKERIAKD